MQSVFETEFRSYMAQVFPDVPKGSTQYKISRVIFYSGGHSMVQKVGERSEQEGDSVVKELANDLGLAIKFAKDGVAPEDTLEDLVESREE